MKSDLELILLYLEGDIDAFETLMDRHKQPVFHMIFGLIGVRSDAEELTQDIFVKLYLKLKTFKHEAKFSTWLYRIVQNTVINYRVKKRLGQFFSLDFLVENHVQFSDHSEPFDTQAINKEEIDLLNHALQDLPFQWRQILVLREVNELSYEEIATVLKCSIGTVKSRLSRAKDKLKLSFESITKGGNHVHYAESQSIS